MSSHEESHCNDLHCHFPGVNNEKDEINDVDIIGDNFNFFIEGQEEAVNENDE